MKLVIKRRASRCADLSGSVRAAIVRAAIVAALLAGLIASGCGGGGDPQPLSMAAFTKQANQICARAEAEVEGEARAITKELSGSSEEEPGGYVSHFLVPWVGTATTELSDLSSPKKVSKQAEEMIAAYEATLAKIESEPKLVLGKDPFVAANKMATQLGLHDCVI
jgi:hypothetical protein